mgnify:CR=1 FL=1
MAIALCCKAACFLAAFWLLAGPSCRRYVYCRTICSWLFFNVSLRNLLFFPLHRQTIARLSDWYYNPSLVLFGPYTFVIRIGYRAVIGSKMSRISVTRWYDSATERKISFSCWLNDHVYKNSEKHPRWVDTGHFFHISPAQGLVF